MTLEDIGAGLRLCRASQWNQVEDDWRCFLELEGGGGRIAEKNGAVAGTVTYLRYCRAFSWVAMMLVDPAARRGGIGSQLLAAALDALAEEPCVRLDATPAGEPLYRRFGFVPEYELSRAKTTVEHERFRGAWHTAARRMESEDFDEVLTRDREIFGADRSALLLSFHGRAPELAWTAWDGALLTGYCFGRPGYRYHQLGPIVAESSDAARALVAGCLATQDGRSIAVDVPRRPEWVEWLVSAGFEIERPFLRMRRGENRDIGLPGRQFAIAGPDFA